MTSDVKRAMRLEDKNDASVLTLAVKHVNREKLSGPKNVVSDAKLVRPEAIPERKKLNSAVGHAKRPADKNRNGASVLTLAVRPVNESKLSAHKNVVSDATQRESKESNAWRCANKEQPNRPLLANAVRKLINPLPINELKGRLD